MKTLKLNEPMNKHRPVVKVSSKLPAGVYVVKLTVRGRSGESLPASLTIEIVKE